MHATKKIKTYISVKLPLNSTIYYQINIDEPFSICVILDCTGNMGCKIEGYKKGKLKQISTFYKLASVLAVNMLGYYIRTPSM